MVVQCTRKSSKGKVGSGKKGGKKVGGGKGEQVEQDNNNKRATAKILNNKQREEKEHLVRKRVQLLDDFEDGNAKKRPTRRKVDVADDLVVKASVEADTEEKKANGDLGSTQLVKAEEGSEGQDGNAGGAENGANANATDKSAHAKVKETIRLFNKHYLHFVQEEETRCAKVAVDKKASKAKASKSTKSKKQNVKEEDIKKKAKRPDLKAVSKMIETNAILYPAKRFGGLPGIRVGHQFYSRAEMVAVGFHSHWLNGIDYMGLSYKKGDYSELTFPLAVAIVLSGMYEDDLDNAEDVIYTGQGGHNLTGNKRQVRDQELKRGNLALKNCINQEIPVRVIRGHVNSSSYSGKVYTYDGLYKVIQYWAEKGISGFTVYKYRLRRLEGQPILTTNQVHFTFGRVPESVAEIRGLVCEDISGGLEDIPIPATNLVDDPPVAPTGYIYIKSLECAKNVKVPAISTGCNCKGNCVDPRTCTCAKFNGSDFPYVHRDGGRLIEAKGVVFECGPKCGCGPGCVNRTSQRGLKYRLEVFRTPKKGWAVRSWDFIPSGAPVCEYVGVIMRADDTEDISLNNYIFDIDCLQTMQGLGGRLRRQGDVSTPTVNSVDESDTSVPEFCIDACSRGNIARFINHSCEPNLFVQCVVSSHHDLGLARVMLFAADNIPPLQELTYDYGYAINSVTGPDGKIVKMACYCGGADCRERLF